jgi:dTDP-4-amino-4,6-dideoxygalactose transaminase
MNKPAILGGKPIFSKDKSIPILRPMLPDIKTLMPRLKKAFQSGQITNASNVKDFEALAAEYLGVKYCIAVSSCTSGLILVQKCLGLKGEVIVPSFTFHATAHSILWNSLTPVFVDCRPDTFNIDEKKIESLINKKTSAILAVYLYGNPPAIAELQHIADKYNLKLIFDSAHAFGSRYKGIKAGRFGDAEVFSLSPTKLLIAGEGGIAATNDKTLADSLKVARNYGDSGNYDCAFNGFNARMAEFNAILGIEGLKIVDKKIKRRNEIAELYTDFFTNYKGVSFQKIEKNNLSTFKDYSIIIDPDIMGIDRDIIAIALEKENIVTKKYFYPPVHMQKAYKSYNGSDLEITEKLSSRVLSFPIYCSLTDEMIDKICYAFTEIIKYKSKKVIK